MSTRGRVSDEDLVADVRSDIAMLVTEAASSEPGPGAVEEISGHGIIDSLSRNWRRLRTSRLRLWE